MPVEHAPPPERYQGPGMVDLQVNGYAGFDFNSLAETWTPEDFHKVRRAMQRRGVAAALPTFITDDVECILDRARKYADLIEDDAVLAKAFPKLHIEGPFISPETGPRGAHPLAHCVEPKDYPGFLDALREASGGRIGILTLAPETEGALDLIARASAQGICAAIGHTMADKATLAAAVDAGAKLSTHLGNGTHALLPKFDNYIQHQLAEDRLAASFIADGHHVPWANLRTFMRAKTLENAILVTDAITGADAPPGVYTLGPVQIEVFPDLRTGMPGHAGLAGSALTLDRAVLNATRHCGVPFPQAWSMASVRPAALVGLPPYPVVEVQVEADGFTAR